MTCFFVIFSNFYKSAAGESLTILPYIPSNNLQYYVTPLNLLKFTSINNRLSTSKIYAFWVAATFLTPKLRPVTSPGGYFIFISFLEKSLSSKEIFRIPSLDPVAVLIPIFTLA